MVARCLARLGVRHMYGVIGIPVTELASAAQVQAAAFSVFLNAPTCLTQNSHPACFAHQLLQIMPQSGIPCSKHKGTITHAHRTGCGVELAAQYQNNPYVPAA